jgi:CRISPR-associated protein Cas2
MGEKRVGKMLKLCRRYLHWIQNSVFEGELGEAQLKMLLAEAKELMDPEEDSLIVFKSRDQHWLSKEVHGKEKNNTDNFL